MDGVRKSGAAGARPVGQATEHRVASVGGVGNDQPERSASAVELPSLPPLIYGYLRMEEPDERAIARLRSELAAFCLGRGWQLGGVFCDRGVGDEVIARVGFTAALDALQLPQAYALLVPSRDHLSSIELVERALVRLVARTGSRVLMLPDEVPADDETGPSA